MSGPRFVTNVDGILLDWEHPSSGPQEGRIRACLHKITPSSAVVEVARGGS